MTLSYLDLTLRCPVCNRRADMCFAHGDEWKRRRFDLRSHEPPRNSGEGTAADGPMPLEGGDESLTDEHE